MRRFPALAAALIVLAQASSAPAGPDGSRAPAPAVENAAARRYFTDVVLANQDGERLRLYSDLLRGKVVVIASFFSTCTASCPVVMGTLAALQRSLGDRLGEDVHLLAFTVDPVRDTPERLKEYARRLGARPGWHFLSGVPENVELALARLGQAVASPDDHLNVLLVGNDRTGLWKKAFALAPADRILAIVRSVLEDG